MTPAHHAEALRRLPDGTVKQINPFTGTQVWTVPGRADRPLAPVGAPAQPIEVASAGAYCAFCELRALEATPEKLRVARDLAGGWRLEQDLTAEQVVAAAAEFRVFPNLFAIVSGEYWRANHARQPSEEQRARAEHYASTPAGLAHLRRLAAVLSLDFDRPTDRDRLCTNLFAGSHDVLTGRRHFRDGATHSDHLASAGSLSVDEHRQFVRLTVRAMRDLYAGNPAVRNVAVFQNWRSPAGASFEHLHKQLVGVDEFGQVRLEELARLRHEPDLFRSAGPGLAQRHGLLIAENTHAVAFAGIGHRFPAVEVWSRRYAELPWRLSAPELSDVADLLHACHAATGPALSHTAIDGHGAATAGELEVPALPSNEEWHYPPPSLASPHGDGLAEMPLHVVLKLRISTPAGFEGSTRIYVNTVDPWTLAQRTRWALRGLSETHLIDGSIKVLTD